MTIAQFFVAAALVAVSGIAVASSAHLQLTVNGVPLINETQSTNLSASYRRSASTNNYAATLEARLSAGYAGAFATVAGTAAAEARVTSTSVASYSLIPPDVGSIDIAGGRLILSAELTGDLVGNASMGLMLTADVFTPNGDVTGGDSGSVADRPGPEQIAFEVVIALPAPLDAAGPIRVVPTLELEAVASIAPGGQVQTSTADARDSGRIVGFRVLNAAGAQVTGFTLKGNNSIPELAPVQVGKTPAVEYFHAEFGHFFITANPAEIRNLDSGTTPGWTRTGQAFSVYTGAAPGVAVAAVCRFFSGTFGGKSSHFYAPRGLGCDALLPTDPVWQYEGDVFYTAPPDANGVCPAGNVPVYRLYNNGQGGAPNHRFTTSESIQLDMIRDGYVAEGTGAGVGMCSPQ